MPAQHLAVCGKQCFGTAAHGAYGLRLYGRGCVFLPALRLHLRIGAKDRTPYGCHYHGDHCFGLPYVLARLQESGRRQPLAVYGGGDVVGKVSELVSLAYPNLLAKLRFPLVPMAVGPDEPFALARLTGLAAVTGHGAPRLTGEDGTLYYSGDGTPTGASRMLAAGCAVVVQESYGMEPGVPGHGAVREAMAMAGEEATVAVVHLQRDMRCEQARSVLAMLEQAPCRAVMPDAGAVITV